jgi:hypothetical protein
MLIVILHCKYMHSMRFKYLAYADHALKILSKH